MECYRGSDIGGIVETSQNRRYWPIKKNSVPRDQRGKAGNPGPEIRRGRGTEVSKEHLKFPEKSHAPPPPRAGHGTPGPCTWGHTLSSCSPFRNGLLSG